MLRHRAFVHFLDDAVAYFASIYHGVAWFRVRFAAWILGRELYEYTATRMSWSAARGRRR